MPPMSSSRTLMTRPPRWRCHTCPAVFTAWAAAQRHADQTGHRRIEVIL